MAVDKNKVTAEATRLAQKGAHDKAIKLYEKLLAEDPKDVRVLLKIGELQQKKGDNAAAAETFGKVADAYGEQGFFLKAVAVYKQMLKLAPDDVRVNERLAGLYQQLGILSDAMGQLQIVAAAAEHARDAARLLDVLKRMVDLEPENVGSAVKLGDLYAKGAQAKLALEQFRRAAEALKRNNRADEYVKVAERIAALAPDDLALTRELAHVYLAKGDTKRALAKLQLLFKADPKDLDTLTALAQAFQDLGQVQKTVSVYRELAHLHEERGKRDEARATWRRLLELAPEDPEALAAASPPRGAPTPPPVPAPAAPRTPPRAAAPAPVAPAAAPAASAAAVPAAPGAEAIPKLLTETDVYVKYGLHEKALEHLKKVFVIDPDHLEAREKALQLRAARGDPAAADEAAAVVRLARARGLEDRAQVALARLRELAPGHPALAAVAGPVARADGPAPEVELTLEVEPAGAEDDLAITAARAGDGDEVEDDEGPTPVGDAELELDEPPAPPPAAAAPPPRPPPRPAAPVVPPPVLAAPAARPPPPPVAPARSPPPVAPARSPPPAAPARSPAPAAPARSPAPAAPARSPAPSALVPPPPAAAGGRASSGAAATPPAPPRAAPVPARAPAPPPAIAPPPVDGAAEDEDLDDEIEEVRFFVGQGLLDEARDALANLLAFYPSHRKLRALEAELERRPAPARQVEARPAAAAPPGAAASPEDGFDIGKELAEELGAGPPLPADEFQYSVEDVFSQFKKGVEQTVTAEDADTHYDLGIAYREMGLLDDALHEFEVALGGKGKKNELDCLTMIALCRMEKGDPKEAVQAYLRALACDGLTAQAARAINYELGAAYEACGDRESALWYLQKVVKADPGYRDAKALVARLGGGPGRPPEPPPLGAPAAGGAPPTPLGAKKNIGYV
jgi:tetratricopeptide (TPR) repeat protein